MSRPPPPQPSPPTSTSTGPPPATPLPLVQSPYLPSAYGDAHFGLLVRHVQGICDVLVETMKRETSSTYTLSLTSPSGPSNPRPSLQQYLQVLMLILFVCATESWRLKGNAILYAFYSRVCHFYVHAAIDPRDQVPLFDPADETYQMCIELARGVPVSLSFSSWVYRLTGTLLVNGMFL
jgi:hypothetical protein